MSAETFALLERAQQGDESACERVLTENTGLIWSVVRRYHGRGVETVCCTMMDLPPTVLMRLVFTSPTLRV